MKRYNCLKILLTVLVLVQNLYSASFIMFRGNEYRSGEVYEIAKLTSTTASMWVFEIQGKIISSPVVKDNIVFFGGRDTSIWALNAINGEVIWQFSTSGFVDSTPIVYNGCVYFISTDGKIYCFKIDLSSEEFPLLWSYDTGSKSYSSPLITEDGKVIFVSGPYINGLPYGYIYILDAKNGSLIDKISLGNFSYSSVSHYNDNLYFTTNDGYVCSYSLKLKKFNWKLKVSSCLSYTTVVPYDDKLYFYAGDVESKIFVLSLDGILISSSSRLSSIATDNTQVAVTTSTLVVNIYPTSTWEEQDVRYSSQTIICLNRQTLDDILWRKDFKIKKSPEESYGVTSAVTVVDDVGYTGLNDGRFIVLDLTTGEILYQYDTNSTIICSPAVSNGWVYFTTVDGKIYGIKSDIFVSIVSPDVKDVVINSTTVKILSSIHDTYELKCINDSEQHLISSGTITSQQTVLNFDSRPLLDGKYKLILYLQGHTGIVKNFIRIDNSPLPPTNLSCLVYDSTKILLTWMKSKDDGDGNNDVEKYNIYYSTDNSNFILKTSVPKGTISYIDTPPLSGSTYYYKLTAVDKNSESDFSLVQSVYLPVILVPVQPEELKIVLQQITTYENILININWNFTGDITKVSYYRIYKSTDGNNFLLLKQLDNNTSFYIDNNCEPHQRYYYRVTVVDNNGEEMMSAVESIQTKYEIEIQSGEFVQITYEKYGTKLQLSFPEGAIDKNITLQIIFEDSKEYIKNVVPLVVYKFLPEGLNFKTPVKIKIYYNSETLAHNVNENLLRIFWYDNKKEKWLLVNSSKVNLKEKYVEADIYHFSCYALAQFVSDVDKIFKDEYVYAVPSPARGDDVYFKFLLYQQAEVKVYVYDVAGDLVWKSDLYKYTEADIGKTHMIKWDIRNVATGMYIFRVEGKNNKTKQNVIKKFTIIH